MRLVFWLQELGVDSGLLPLKPKRICWDWNLQPRSVGASGPHTVGSPGLPIRSLWQQGPPAAPGVAVCPAGSQAWRWTLRESGFVEVANSLG